MCQLRVDGHMEWREVICHSCSREGASMRHPLDVLWRPILSLWECVDGEACFQEVLAKWTRAPISEPEPVERDGAT